MVSLGIIGIIAAMTVPNLISKIDKETRLSQFKIAYKLLKEVAELSYMENGYPPRLPSSGLTNAQLFDIYYRPYLKIVKDCGIGNQTGKDRCFASPNGGFYNLQGVEPKNYPPSNYYKVILQNGMSLAVIPTQQTEPGVNNFHSSAIFIIDVDGPSKGYSKLGQDVFYFSYVDSSHYGDAWDCQKIPHVPGVLPGGLNWYQYPTFCRGSGRADGIGNCAATASSSNGRNSGTECSTAIIKNGLQYPKDYPWNAINKRPAGFVKYK